MSVAISRIKQCGKVVVHETDQDHTNYLEVLGEISI